MITTDPDHIADQVERAIANPATVADSRGESETTARWQARAALTRIAGDLQSAEIVGMVHGVLAATAWEGYRAQADAVCTRLAALFGEAAAPKVRANGHSVADALTWMEAGR